MKYLAFVSGDDVKLGAEELKQLSDTKKYSIHGQIVVFDGEKFDYSRLACTRRLYEFLFVTTKKKLESDCRKFSWEKYYKGSFRVDRSNLDLELSYLGSLVWHGLKKPKVDLEHAKTRIDFLCHGGKIFVGLLLFENAEDFTSRRPHLRPGFHPTSLQPKLARALINLAKVRKGGAIADPFCGTGGILLEAALLGYKVVGSDFSDEMVGFCRTNFEHFGFKGWKCFKADATAVKIGADAVICDPPYGRCASLGKFGRMKLYKDFLDNAYRQLKKGSRVVIMFPNEIKVKGKFKIIVEVNHYMHHSLTRHILVLEK